MSGPSSPGGRAFGLGLPGPDSGTAGCAKPTLAARLLHAWFPGPRPRRRPGSWRSLPDGSMHRRRVPLQAFLNGGEADRARPSRNRSVARNAAVRWRATTPLRPVGERRESPCYPPRDVWGTVVRGPGRSVRHGLGLHSLLLPSVPRTSVTGSSPLLPTPRASENSARRGGRRRRRRGRTEVPRGGGHRACCRRGR